MHALVPALAYHRQVRFPRSAHDKVPGPRMSGHGSNGRRWGSADLQSCHSTTCVKIHYHFIIAYAYIVQITQ